MHSVAHPPDGAANDAADVPRRHARLRRNFTLRQPFHPETHDAPVGDGEDSSSLLDLISCEVAGRPFGTEEAMVAGLDRETLLADVEDALSILNPAHRRGQQQCRSARDR